MSSIPLWSIPPLLRTDVHQVTSLSKKCYFFNLLYISTCIIYHCQFYSTEGAKAISTLWRRMKFFLKKRIPPLPSNQRRNPISLCCHIIFPECLLETERCTVIPGNSESLVMVSNSHQISQVVETLKIIEWRITCFAWIPKSVRKLNN